MSKDLYDLFNDSRTDADEKLNNYTYDDLPESEVEHIMNSVMDRKKKYKRDNSSNLYVIGFAVVIVLIVSFLGFALWKRFNPLNKYDNMVVNSNDEEENDIDYATSTEEEDKQQSTETDQSDQDTKNTAETDSDNELDEKGITDKSNNNEETSDTNSDENNGQANQTAESSSTEKNIPNEYLSVEGHSFTVISSCTFPNNTASQTDASYREAVEKTGVTDNPNEKNVKIAVWNAGGDLDFNWTTVLFSVMGENIEKIHFSIDKCSLYTQIPTDINPDYFINGPAVSDEDRGIKVDRYNTWAIFSPYGDIESIDLVSEKGNDFTIDYSKELKVGFFIPYETTQRIIEGYTDPYPYYSWYEDQEIVNELKEAVLTVEITFSDGYKAEKKYRVHPGPLKYDTVSETGYRYPIPEFAQDGEEYVYGVILEEIN